MVLTSKKINFDIIDIAASEEAKAKMRELMGDPKGLPPQICNNDIYCGVSKRSLDRQQLFICKPIHTFSVRK